MKPSICWLAASLACASASVREPTCAAPAGRVEIQQVQIGWQRQDPPPQGDPRAPTRDAREAETLAKDLLVQCRKGGQMEVLQDRYSDVPAGSVVVGPRAKVPFKSAALCLQKNECALVRSDVAFHVLKRIG